MVVDAVELDCACARTLVGYLRAVFADRAARKRRQKCRADRRPAVLESTCTRPVWQRRAAAWSGQRAARSVCGTCQPET